MASEAYQFGLLLAIVGGFLSIGSSGVPASLGVWAMFLGLCIGAIGVLHSGLPDRSRAGDSSETSSDE